MKFRSRLTPKREANEFKTNKMKSQMKTWIDDCAIDLLVDNPRYQSENFFFRNVRKLSDHGFPINKFSRLTNWRPTPPRGFAVIVRFMDCLSGGLALCCPFNCLSIAFVAEKKFKQRFINRNTTINWRDSRENNYFSWLMIQIIVEAECANDKVMRKASSEEAEVEHFKKGFVRAFCH